jgi:hypothetical protein
VAEETNPDIWQPIWDYLTDAGIAVPSETITITIDGHEFTTAVPDELRSSS